MKQRFIFVSIGLILGFLLGYYVKPLQSEKSEDIKDTVDKARDASVELNIQFNQLYNELGRLAIGEGNDYAIFALKILQQLTPNIMQISKSLDMDCKQYGENGKPVMIEDAKTRQRKPIEVLPEEIRIEE